MRFLLKVVCSFFFAVGVLSLVLLSANELLGLGIWQHDAYPVIEAFPIIGQDKGLYGQVSATFWHSIAQFATITVVAGVVGAVFWFFLGDDDTENETVETDDPDAKLTIADLERRYGGSGPD